MGRHEAELDEHHTRLLATGEIADRQGVRVTLQTVLACAKMKRKMIDNRKSALKIENRKFNNERKCIEKCVAEPMINEISSSKSEKSMKRNKRTEFVSHGLVGLFVEEAAQVSDRIFIHRQPLHKVL